MIIAIQAHGRLAHLADGIVNSGNDDTLIFLDDDTHVYPAAQLHIFWGFRAYLDAVHKYGLKEDAPVIIADKGFVRRPSVMLSLGGEWGGLARWPEVPSKRIEIPDWQFTCETVALIIGQDPNDFSTKQAVKNFNKWKFDITKELQEKGWTVRFREHPRNLLFAPADVPRPKPLLEDLRDVGLVVGLNSGALVECFLAGYPVHAVDEHSLVHPFSASFDEPGQDEPEGRQAFFSRLAGLSWTYRELADGRAWESIVEQVFDGPVPESPPGAVPTQAPRKAPRKRRATG